MKFICPLITVADIKRSRDFYEELLNLKVNAPRVCRLSRFQARRDYWLILLVFRLIIFINDSQRNEDDEGSCSINYDFWLSLYIGNCYGQSSLILDRLSFKKFLVLESGNKVPDEKTVWL